MAARTLRRRRKARRPFVSFKQTFSFQAPDALRDSNAQAIDSLAGTWRMEGMEVHYDFGWHSSDLREFADQVVQRSE